MGSRVSSPTFVCVSCSTRTTAATAQGALVSVSASLCAAALWMETCPSSTWLSSKAEGGQRGQGGQEKEVRLSPRVQALAVVKYNLTVSIPGQYYCREAHSAPNLLRSAFPM